MIRSTAPKAADQTLMLALSGERLVQVAIRRVPQARRLTLRLRAAHQDAVLTIPAQVSLAQAKRFAEKHVGWLQSRLEALPQRIPFEPGSTIPLRGIPHRLEHRPSGRTLASLETVDGAPVIAIGGDVRHFARRTTDFLRKLARADLEASVARHAAAIGVRTIRLRLSDPVSRWGSCSSAGSLSFSWRLILAPAAVLDYLAAHEVAHRRQMNHGPAFWAEVQRLCPTFRDSETWLRKHGAGLHAFGPPRGGDSGKETE